MKRRLLALCLVFAMFVTLATGCGEASVQVNKAKKEESPLRVCFDLACLGVENESPDYNYENAVEAAAQGLMLEVVGRGGPSDFKIEIIPKEEAARKSMLTKLRTEIMSGEGPDVFIMGCDGSPYGTMDMLFPIPEKAMQNGLLLPLDDYMENSTQFTEWDKLQQTVLRSGSNDEGQQIIPIAYTLPVTFYRSAEVDLVTDAKMSWYDMIHDETGVLSSAASWFNMNYDLSHMRGSYIEYTFGQLGDYEAETLTFTEDELAKRIEEIEEINAKVENGSFTDVPAHYKTCLSVNFNNEAGGNPSFLQSTLTAEGSFSGIKPTEAQTMIPIYSDDGGATAAITAYAAISINTERPEDAFMVIDVLMDIETQKKSVLYEYWFTQLYGIPMHEELLQPTCPAMYTAKSKPWYLREENYAELCRLRDQITFARFRGGLDIEMKKAYYAYEEAMRSGADNVDEVIAESYRRMERLLGE